jgi:uncharacterized lipoprotein YmbA
MKTLSLAASLLLLGCATTGTDTTGSGALQLSAGTDAAAESASDAVVVKELEISAFAEDETVCRREAPLGSRIAVERCWSTTTGNSSDALRSQIQRDEFEEMRQRQMMIDQQQRAARDNVFRQRAMGPSQ